MEAVLGRGFCGAGLFFVDLVVFADFVVLVDLVVFVDFEAVEGRFFWEAEDLRVCPERPEPEEFGLLLDVDWLFLTVFLLIELEYRVFCRKKRAEP
ncbi:hypothetical protein [Allobaculum sp. JKK-2023]|uniref:hypothetical protein n=1 Tax=Allobaculum sp. JKK-2023 TaxID=3108943 RepID=UPI002B061756|nr:hypothetical protein [Allobaculum sp. JKK-2023]